MRYIIALGGNEPINPDGRYTDVLGSYNPNGRLVVISDEDYDLKDEDWTIFQGTITSLTKHKSSKGSRYYLQLHRIIAQRVWSGDEPFSHNHIVKFKDGNRYNMQRENIVIEVRGQRNRSMYERARKEMERINNEGSGLESSL
ncbi:MAG: hypothetical protein DDT19_02614 [Syntrophomonadaceae bacterium]|nr:hypothetical protein [Bacillota bacterium]